MREAGYLTSVYKNVYLDFGEVSVRYYTSRRGMKWLRQVFPMVSAEGQRNVIRQVLELCPTNKIMWSSEFPWFGSDNSMTQIVQAMDIGGQSHIFLGYTRRERHCLRYQNVKPDIEYC
jgi:predicted TIM-barrel fold metal-dependent hydrolase